MRTGTTARDCGLSVSGRIRLAAFDLDGVIWRGGKIIPGVAQALEDVVRRDLMLRYVSNNSTAHRRVVSQRLHDLGLPDGTERVLTSAFVTARWLGARLPAGAPVMVLGEQGLLEELAEVGIDAFHACDRPGESTMPVAVVVGMDRSIDFTSLSIAQRAIRQGAQFVATNRDATFPTPDGEVPGAGAIVAAVATAAESEPVLMGKPGLGLAEVLADTTGVPAENTFFVGDRIGTDIVMGNKAGMVTALVLTGVTAAEELAEGWPSAEERPDHVLADLSGLSGVLDALGV